MTHRDPSHFVEIATGFWRAKTFLSAVELELFTLLGEGAMTGRQIQGRLGLHPRAIPDFPDALVALKVLERDGEGPAARYSNSEESSLFLDKNKATYIGGFFEMLNGRLYGFWGDLTEALQTGRPQNEIKHSGAPVFEELYWDPERLEQFMGAMTGLSLPNFEAFATKFDFSGYATMCDIGGATGQLSIIVARNQPHMRCTTCDLPAVETIARKTIQEQGLSDRIQAASLDFFQDPFPRADVITMGMILHDWNLEKKMHLIRSAYKALPEGGALVAIENLIDDERRSNIFGMMMSLNMLIEFGDAFDFTGRDFDLWCTQVGFRNTEVIPLRGPAAAAVAYK